MVETRPLFAQQQKSQQQNETSQSQLQSTSSHSSNETNSLQQTSPQPHQVRNCSSFMLLLLQQLVHSIKS